jgi:hypothetical protein
VFGATEEDMAKVRIVSLYELDLEKLDRMASEGSPSSSGGEEERVASDGPKA